MNLVSGVGMNDPFGANRRAVRRRVFLAPLFVCVGITGAKHRLLHGFLFPETRLLCYDGLIYHCKTVPWLIS